MNLLPKDKFCPALYGQRRSCKRIECPFIHDDNAYMIAKNIKRCNVKGCVLFSKSKYCNVHTERVHKPRV